MTPLERAIIDAVSRAVQGGHLLRGIYLRPQDMDELGSPRSLGGLPVRQLAGKRGSTIYTKSGVAIPISVPRTVNAIPGFTPTEQLVLVSLRKGWPCAPKRAISYRLQRRGLAEIKSIDRRHRGRDCTIHQLCLTARGEADAHQIWERLTREQRARLHEAALRSGL